VVAYNTVHESPGDRAWACAMPPRPTEAIGATAGKIANVVAEINRSLRMMDGS
jgi:hypothetical protein